MFVPSGNYGLMFGEEERYAGNDMRAAIIQRERKLDRLYIYEENGFINIFTKKDYKSEE